MCSLVMSLFSRDYIKTEIDQLKYQQCFNLQEYNNHTVPGFKMVEHQYLFINFLYGRAIDLLTDANK